jgi:hypothetical protein
MTDQQRQEMKAELEIITGWSPIYLKSLTDEQLIKLHKEKVKF